MARGRIGLEVEDKLLELLDGTEDVECFDILDGGFEVFPERRDTSVAALELSKVVIPNHSIEEASGELGDHKEVKLRERFRGLSLNGTNSDGNEVGGGLARFEILGGGPVRLNVIEVCHDLSFVENHVLCHSGDDISLGLEDLGPCLDGSDVFMHSFASSKNSGETSNNCLDVLSGCDPVASLNVRDDTLNLGNNALGIRGAELDLSEVVVSDKTLKETTKEEEWSLNWHSGHVSTRCGFDGTNSEGKSISGVLAGLEVVFGSPVGLLSSNVSLDL